MSIIHRIIEPDAAEVIKRALVDVSSEWVGMYGQTPIVIIEIDEVPHAIASRLSAFGAGHLEIAGRFQEGGQGVAVKTAVDNLEKIDSSEVMGFIHFHRSLMDDTVAFRSAEPGSPIAEAVEFFRKHPDENHAFFPVVFRCVGSECYPWRAMPTL